MEQEALYRFGVFASVLIFMSVLEVFIPKRVLRRGRLKRWVTNFSFGGINIAVVRIMAISSVPLVAMSVAVVGQAYGFGLLPVLNELIVIPYWAWLILSLLILDFAIYVQHWASHKFSILWQIHQVHHSDQDIDVTTAVRFHPIEIGLSMLYKVLLVLLLGIDPFAVLLFEIILNGCAMFNHSNIALPKIVDRLLRLVIVTPDMHRVHHSIERNETDSNYGFNLAIWDRLFGTYIAAPQLGHLDMRIGLPQAQDNENPTQFGWSFLLPFAKKI